MVMTDVKLLVVDSVRHLNHVDSKSALPWSSQSFVAVDGHPVFDTQ